MDEPEESPFGGFPFGGMPLFGDLAKMFAAQGPLHWDAARQFAALTATGGEGEANVDPALRFQLADLARIAELHVQQVSGLTTAVRSRPVEVAPVTPGVWAQRTLEDYRPLFTELASSLSGATGDDADADTGDPAAAMLAGLSKMMAPAMLGMAVGAMVGQLARRAFGQYDLPIPRSSTASELLIVPQAIDGFADDWSIPVDEMRLWVLTQELAGHAVLGVTHVRERLSSLVRRHVGAFRPDASAIFDRLGELDPTDPTSMESLQRTLSDPTVLIGAVRTPEQDLLRPQLDTVLAVVIGFVDHVVDQVSTRVLGDASRIAEAARRRRIEILTRGRVRRTASRSPPRPAARRTGPAFVDGVRERAGADGLAPLFTRADGLPTVPELEAPGLWLARLELES
jgi:putative hydrolase